nr:unnamed protein product [Naegleria fowleri]
MRKKPHDDDDAVVVTRISEWYHHINISKTENEMREFLLEQLDQLANYLNHSLLFVEQFERRWSLGIEKLREIVEKLLHSRKFPSKFLMKYLQKATKEKSHRDESHTIATQKTKSRLSDELMQTIKLYQAEFFHMYDKLRTNGISDPNTFVKQQQTILQTLYGRKLKEEKIIDALLLLDNPLSISKFNLTLAQTPTEKSQEPMDETPEQESNILIHFFTSFDKDINNLEHVTISEEDIPIVDALTRSPAIIPQSLLNHTINVPLAFISKVHNQYSIYQRVGNNVNKTKLVLDQYWKEMEHFLSDDSDKRIEFLNAWNVKKIIKAYVIGNKMTKTNNLLLRTLEECVTYFKDTHLVGAAEISDGHFSPLDQTISMLDQQRDIYHYAFECNKEVKSLIGQIVKTFAKQCEELRETKQTKMKQHAQHKLGLYNYNHRIAHYLLLKPVYSFISSNQHDSTQDMGVAFFEMHPSSLEKRRNACLNFLQWSEHDSFGDIKGSTVDLNIRSIQELESRMLENRFTFENLKDIQSLFQNIETDTKTAKGNIELFPQKVLSFIGITNPDRMKKLQAFENREESSQLKKAENPTLHKSFSKLTKLRRFIMSFLAAFVLKSAVKGSVLDVEDQSMRSIFGFMSPLSEDEKQMFKLMVYDYQRAKLFKLVTDKGLFLLPETHLLIKEFVPKKYLWMSPSQKLVHYTKSYQHAHYIDMNSHEIEDYENILLKAVPLMIRRGEDMSNRYILNNRELVLRVLAKRCHRDLRHAKQSLLLPSLVLLHFLYFHTPQRSQQEIVFSYWHLFEPSHFKYIVSEKI